MFCLQGIDVLKQSSHGMLESLHILRPIFVFSKIQFCHIIVIKFKGDLFLIILIIVIVLPCDDLPGVPEEAFGEVDQFLVIGVELVFPDFGEDLIDGTYHEVDEEPQGGNREGGKVELEQYEVHGQIQQTIISNLATAPFEQSENRLQH